MLKWDETKLRELGQYFKELEYLLRNCGVTDHTQMKEYAARYVFYDTADIWTGLAKFSAPVAALGNQAPAGANYKIWRAAIICLYLGAKESTKYMVSNLQKFVQDTFDNGIYTIGNLSTYYKNFTHIARWLVQNGKLYRNEEHRLFQQGFPMSIWVRIASHLEVVSTNHHLEEPYNIEAVFEADLLERQLQSLKNQVFDGIEIHQPKQLLKSYRPLATAPIPSAAPPTDTHSSTPPSTAPMPVTNSIAKSTIPKQIPIVSAPLPLHTYAGLPNHYAPPTQHNFAASDKQPEGGYQPMAPIYNIEKSNHVFTHIMKTPITLSVEELCSIVPDVWNQVKTAVTPKCILQATVQDIGDIDDALPRFAVTADPVTNTNMPIKQQLIKATSVDLIETYLKLLSPGEEPAKDSHAICSIMVTVDSCQEVEAIVDSGSQIISMSAKIANELGISYDPYRVLNMQSANSTIDWLLELTKNVPCTIDNLIFYLQIHILRSPAYNILLG
ncbi:hypothetical protein C0992_006227 [Termitomyces sp. T32_za158]|nr:hypothetical protein C0992_006227 [Termitomyces sp. T32_za158]